MGSRARRQAQALGQFLGDHRLRIIAEDDMKLMLAAINIIEEPLGIKHPAGSGYGDDYSQADRSLICKEQEYEGREVSQQAPLEFDR
jgi:hypothetical protein